MSLPSLKLFLQRSQIKEPSRYWNEGRGPANGGGRVWIMFRPRIVPTPRDMIVTPLLRPPLVPLDSCKNLCWSSLIFRVRLSFSSRSYRSGSAIECVPFKWSRSSDLYQNCWRHIRQVRPSSSSSRSCSRGIICCCCCRIGGRPAPRPLEEEGVVEGPGFGDVEFAVEVETGGSDFIATGVDAVGSGADDDVVGMVGVLIIVDGIDFFADAFISSNIFSSLMASAMMSFFRSWRLETEAIADANGCWCWACGWCCWWCWCWPSKTVLTWNKIDYVAACGQIDIAHVNEMRKQFKIKSYISESYSCAGFNWIPKTKDYSLSISSSVKSHWKVVEIKFWALTTKQTITFVMLWNACS